ncbi:PHD finger-like domain-containing protein 5A [Araneus ventricosus]|uniref:PHD finger-like domain-containing protein 5A n=1 Tax=Araneus ventricosus TaxID=182803 RepID=A0A4Y2UIH9_ARAVE|nr:PHD finger-like domain-containing protein 5A [Araneus ventricosus]
MLPFISFLCIGDGKCVICDSYVRPCTLVRICDECNYGSYQGRCVICGGPGVSDAYYCKECTIQEKDIKGLEVDTNDIDEPVEENNQELTTEELMELHCVSQQESMEESLSEKVTAKQQSSTAIREMLKAWETVASVIEKHHPNKTVVMHATNLFNDNTV